MPMEQKGNSAANVLVVDDARANLQVLAGMLKERGLKVRPVPSGMLALQAAQSEPPDLFLLDINMPEMNGFELCNRIKADKRLRDIPVIFISALNETADKVHAFQVGGVDYITKPFQFEEVMARVDTHLHIRTLQQKERELLEQTLDGTVKAMIDLANMLVPAAFNRASSVSRIVWFLAQRLELEDAWQYELAASLAQIGCATLPPDLLEKIYVDKPLSEPEEKLFRSHPAIGMRLLSNIPRLESVAGMIGRQLEIIPPHYPDNDPVRLGASLLRLASSFDRQLTLGLAAKEACEVLRNSRRERFHPVFLELLESYVDHTQSSQHLVVDLNDLRPKMILDADIVGRDGMLLVRKGVELTAVMIERIRNFMVTWGVKGPFRVRQVSR